MPGCPIFFAESYHPKTFTKASVIRSDLLEPLGQCASIAAVRLALQSLCNAYGTMAQLDIVHASHSGKRQAVCFWRMDADLQEQRLMHDLGMSRFGGYLVLVVDLQPQEACEDRFSMKASSSSIGRALQNR